MDERSSRAEGGISLLGVATVLHIVGCFFVAQSSWVAYAPFAALILPALVISYERTRRGWAILATILGSVPVTLIAFLLADLRVPRSLSWFNGDTLPPAILGWLILMVFCGIQDRKDVEAMRFEQNR